MSKRISRLGIAGMAAAAALLLVGGASGAPASKITVWTDKDRKTAVEKVVGAWAASKGLSVEVVEKDFGKIRDDLKTVQPETAPDVIIGAHDWTGQLAADGLVLPLFPSKATRAQFPAYALNAFSYGTAVKRLYGAPVVLENIGLVVNTKLAKVPTSFAQFQSAALAFKRKGGGRLAVAVPQGAGGDAYHMYPFFSGLGGYVFGKNKIGNLDPSDIGVANKTFLSNAAQIDAWNTSGFLNSKIDYGVAKDAFLKGRAAFWITGPWESDTLKGSKLPFKIVQVPPIKFRSVPFLGVQGFMVTKFAAAHGLESAAKDLVGSYMMRPAGQVALAAANGRFPANLVAGKAVKDPVLAQFGKAGAGGVPMPNIPQMSSVWSDLGGAWVKATKGAGATKARKAFSTAAPDTPTKNSKKGGGEQALGGDPPCPPRSLIPGLVPSDPGGSALSTTVAPHEPERTSRLSSATAAAWSAPARLVAAFSGTVGLLLKIALLAVVNALAVWGGTVLAAEEKWSALAVLAAATLALDAIYLSPRRAIPLKFLIPGTVFLVAFQIVPIVYNVNVGFTNWSTGHILVKSEAIEGIKRNSLGQTAAGTTYAMAPARDEDGELVLLLVDEADGKQYVGTEEQLQPLDEGTLKLGEFGTIESAQGYEIVKGKDLLALDQELASFTVPTPSGAIRAEGTETALELAPTLRYSRLDDTFTRIEDGKVFRDNGRGSFVAATGEELEPGWRTNVGLANFSAVLSDPLIREPFLRVFAWTFVFALSIVLISFALGLFLAIVLDKPTLRFRRVYQLLLVVPYALPGFLAVLIWGGLLNDDFGVVNNLLHANIPWLFDPWWAKVSVIAVSVWLTVPYFLLISLGALQSIPGELVEAARVDGGGGWAIFRRVTLPLLLIVVAPLMIASFAVNFNSFVTIYLLTAGGPPSEDQSIAGATDILITYTYKLAFEAGKGNDFGLASAVSIFIFMIVAAITGAAFWKSGSLENVR